MQDGDQHYLKLAIEAWVVEPWIHQVRVDVTCASKERGYVKSEKLYCQKC